MRKAIQLRVMLWIEGEDAPSHDFAKSTIQAVREIIAEGVRAHPGLEVTVKKISEDTNFADETDDQLESEKEA